MQIYLPIAEIPVNVFSLLLLGVVTGFLSGMFGIGGGFLVTPFLIFMGVPAAVSVATSANQIIAASVSGFLAHLRRQNVDIRMGLVLTIGGFVGSSMGVSLFRYLQEIGQIELVISLCYVTFLGVIGMMMAVESARTIWRKRQDDTAPGPSAMQKASWTDMLPFKMEFTRSRLKISVLLPLAVGTLAGVLVSLMGIGGGFIMIPAMIYLLRMPTNVVIGTSLFQIIFITANVTFLQSIQTQTVDVILAMLLLSGSVVGAQFGTKAGTKLPAEQLRGLLSLIVLAVAIRLGIGLFITPDDIYSVTIDAK